MAAVPPPPDGFSALSPTARELLARRARSAGGSPSSSSIPHRSGAVVAPVSSRQEQLWLFEQVEPGNAVHHVSKEVRFRGRLDVAALEQALTAVVRRHEILRTRYETTAAGEMRQCVMPPHEVALHVADACGPDLALVEGWREHAAADSLRPFDLSAGEVMRAKLYRFASEDHLLHLVFHHIAFDGWSTVVFLRDLAVAYRGALRGAAALQDPPIQYGDFAAWEHDRLNAGAYEDALDFWRRRLGGAPALSTIPTSHPRPAERTYAAGRERIRLTPDLEQDVRALGQAQGATASMVLLAAFTLLLSRYADADDLVVGVPVAGRNRSEQEDLVGYFVNVLPVRVDLTGEPSFRQLIDRVRAASLEAFTHQSVPFDQIVAAVGPPRAAGVTPLVQTAYNHRSYPDQAPEFEGLEVEVASGFHGRTLFDLDLDLTGTPRGIECVLTYSRELYDPAYARRFLELFRRLVTGAVRDPGRQVGEIDLSSEGERRQVQEWNRTERPLPRRAIHELFSDVAAGVPDAMAVADTRERLTYAELDARSHALARRLVEAGVERGERVGVCMERSVSLVAALLGVLKAGGCYVPLDPALPRQRLEFLIRDAGIRRVLAAGSAPPALQGGGVEVIDVDTVRGANGGVAPPVAREPGRAGDVAYVLYTSGSTGEPKGVAVSHRAVVRLVRGSDYVELRPDDVVAQASTASFDAATFEIWGALLNGARLEVIPRAVLLAPLELEESLEKRGVTTLFLTTALFNQVARQRPGAFGSLRHLLFGGETADASAARRVLESGSPPERLIHVYGPTENTTFSTWHTVRHVPPGVTTLPIGRPIANSTAWVLDRRGRPQPLGVWGELYVGGAGVAEGYLGDGHLGSDRFLPDPFASRPGQRLYRTGDRARWTLGGELEFGGRLDGQVKLRGFRIEPGEVEAALRRCRGVREAAVVIEGEGAGRRLVAYVAGPADLDPSDVRDALRGQLPAYMVPGAVVVMEAIPLTASGKLDRRMLPARAATHAPKSRPPGDPLEREIAAIWRDLLGLESVGAHESFFDAGGHSILALEMIRRVEEVTGRTLRVQALFEEPTVAHVARVLALDALGTDSPIVQLRGGDPGVPPFFFFHGDFNGAGLYTRNLVRELDPMRPMFIVHPHQPGGPETIEAMAEDLLAAVRRVRPHGPYLLGGHCNGGVVAFEVAQRLIAGGEVVELLALVDVPGRNIGLAPYAAFLHRVGRLLHVPAARRCALFLATRGPAERLVHRWATAAARGSPGAPWHRAAAVAAWAVDTAARAVTRLVERLNRVRGNAGTGPSPEPMSERIARADYFGRAMQSYVPQRYPGRLVLVTPSDEGPIHGWNRPGLWVRMADRAEVRAVSGDHLSILSEDSQPLGAVLRELMRDGGARVEVSAGS